MEELPLACSLSGPDRARRLAELASLSDRVVSVESRGSGAVLRFRGSGDTAERLRGIVAAERDCCPFLDLSLDDRGSELWLSIAGPDGAEPTIGEIVGALSGARR